MSQLRAVQNVLPTGGPLLGADDLETIRAAIDWSELANRGWDEASAVFRPAADDPLFGYFSAGGRQPTEELCLVCRTPGYERPARARGLCDICARTARGRGQSVRAYVEGDAVFPPAPGRPSFGRCSVTACERWAHKRKPALCEPHDRNWRAGGRPAGAALDAWCREAGSVDLFTRRATLIGLSEQVTIQILFGLHEAVCTERRTEVTALQTTVRTARATRAGRLAELPLRSMPRNARLFVSFVMERLGLALTSPEAEIHKDRWDMRVFGRRGGWINFGHLRQTWLQEAAKAWCWERLPIFDNPARLAQIVFDLGPLSESLTRHRPDSGDDPAVLSRADIIAFCNDLAHLEAVGRLSAYMRHRVQVDTELFLRQSRSIGLTRPGAAMAGMAEDVAFSPSDRSSRPRPPAEDEVGRSIPQVVLEQLLCKQALGGLEAAAGADVRAMVELQARVGRRPGELCGLVWDCLTTEEVLDEAGQTRTAPVLVHDMPKVGVRGLRLPIDTDTAAIVASQQERVRQRYPHTPGRELKLFPAPFRNSRGTRGLFPGTVAENLRDWVAQLPILAGPDGRDYPRSDVTMYAFRHSYAQRLADNGTPVEVLAALLGHAKLSTTQGYYRVTQKRKRKAIDQLAAMQLNARGERTRPVLESLTETEHARELVGQVAVPFGICHEPSNVKAGGQDCPFRHQCFGCVHFRSDPSFLPELRQHLDRLLTDREHLLTTSPELDDWARLTALPSEKEISAVRSLIQRCEALLDQLGEADRHSSEEAIRTLRHERAQLDTSFPVRFRHRVRPPDPNVFPNLTRESTAPVP